MYRKFLTAPAIAIYLLFSPGGIYAQNNHIEVTKNLNYRQPVRPAVLDNYLFSTYYGAGKKAYNLKGFEIASPSGKVIDIKVNPAGHSYALLFNNGKQNSLKIYDIYKANQEIFDFGKFLSPRSIVYSADSRSLYVADSYSTLRQFDSKSLQQTDQWAIPFSPSGMVASNNGYFIAGYLDNTLIIINPETHDIRRTETSTSPILDITFSDDSSIMGVVLQSGEVDLYNTRDFTPFCQPVNRPGAEAISIHPDNKYIALVENGNRIELVNLIDNAESAFLTEPIEKTDYVRFLKDEKANIFLTFNAADAIKYRLIKGLMPNYSKMIREEIIQRLEEWSKMTPGETEQQYLARVNEENRLAQARLFEEEIATRMAEDLVARSTVTLGAYNPSNNTLSVQFDNMPPIYLTVPEKDVNGFVGGSDLEFRNPLYGVTADDRFELVYAQVYNKKTGKTYEFNNREHRTLDYLYTSEDFVPIELVRQTGMEEIRLTGIRNKIVDQAMQDKLISRHTDIDVSTGIVNDVDASGRQITNYKINFKYTVESGYSAKEDFPAGKYQVNQSNAARSMLQIISQAFATDFAQYIKPGRKVIVTVTGSADGLPITGKIGYDGSFGEFFNEPCNLGNNLSTITLNKADGIRTNEQLAFARATAVKDYITKNVKSLNLMNTDYRYRIELSDKKGGEYRRISVDFTFVDAF